MKNLLALLLLISFHAFALEGVYTVPLEDESLQEYSSFKIEGIRLTKDEITFRLPALLASQNVQDITFSRIEGETKMYSSELGTVACIEDDEKKGFLSCSVLYNELYRAYLKNNLKSLEKELQDSDFSLGEQAQMLEVAAHFSGTPIGVLRFRASFRYPEQI